MAATNVLSGTRLSGRQHGGHSLSQRQQNLLPNRQRQQKFGGSSTRIEVEYEAKSFLDASKVDIPGYRNTYKHNVCLEMLREGYHESFRELIALVTAQKEERERAGRASGCYFDPLLENEEQKLDQLRAYLSAAEEARREGDIERVYTSLQSLAEYFEETNDMWLADHFRKRCLETSLEIKTDGQRKEGEAHCNMGLSYEAKGCCSEAARHFEQFYSLAKSNKWFTQDGQNLVTLASDCLRRIYTMMAEEIADGDSQGAIRYLLKAYEMAKEVDSETEGLASYRVGNAYESTGDSKTAIDYHKVYLEKCKQVGDDAGLGAACQALAKSYESLGDLGNAVRFLEMFVEVADRTKQHEQMCRAQSSLGAMYNTLGQFAKAVDCFNKSYDFAQELGSAQKVAANRVRYGVGAAHSFFSGYSVCIGGLQVTSLLEWKDRREQEGVETNAVESDPVSEEVRSVEISSDLESSETQEQETTEEVLIETDDSADD